MRLLILSAVVLGALLCTQPASAEDVVHIDVSPLFPTDSTPVTLEAWAWFSDPGQEFVSASYVRDESQITIDVIMQDSQSVLPVVVRDGGSVDVGILPAGLYEVAADMWMIPYGGDVPEYYGSGSTSFDVVPEPSALVFVLLGTTSLLLSAGRGKR